MKIRTRCFQREVAHGWRRIVMASLFGDWRVSTASLALLLGHAMWQTALPPCGQATTNVGLPCVAQGTVIAVRLTSAVDGIETATAVPFTALVISPVFVGGTLAIAPGTPVWGRQTRGGRDRQSRPVLQLTFDSLGIAGQTIPIAWQLTGVDNVREFVDSAGLIVGAASRGAMHSPTSWVSLLLGTFHPVAAAALLAESRGHALEHGRPIRYAAGTDISAIVSSGLVLPSWASMTSPPPADENARLAARAATWPLRAANIEDSLVGDPLNVAFFGDSATITAAFLAAEWDVPGRMDVHADLMTFIKAVERRGYTHQPVSRQDLSGRPPSMVFQKVGNTFTKRHHIRIWRWAEANDSALTGSIFLAAATHDIGVTFDTNRRSFTHRVDAAIDAEREKVIDDLWFAGCLDGVSRLPRVLPGSLTVNDGRDLVVSDGQLAVIRLRQGCTTKTIR